MRRAGSLTSQLGSQFGAEEAGGLEQGVAITEKRTTDRSNIEVCGDALNHSEWHRRRTKETLLMSVRK